MSRLVAIIALMAFGSGCASIISGSRQEVSFVSNPEGATVTVGGRTIGKTPVTISLKRESGQSIVFSKESYKSLTMRLDTRLNGWFWGNIVLGGFFGSTTDSISGAVHEYSPSQYMVTLSPAGSESLERKSSLSVRQKAMEFIVVAYRSIMADLRKGQGDYLSSLLNLLGVPVFEKSQAVKKIRALSEAYADIPEFADRVVDLYVKEAPVQSTDERPTARLITGSGEISKELQTLKPGTKLHVVTTDKKSLNGGLIEFKDGLLWIRTLSGKMSLYLNEIESLGLDD